MRTQPAHPPRPRRRPLAAVALAVGAPLVAPATASAQAGAEEGASLAVAVLLACAGVMFVAAGVLGYRWPQMVRSSTADSGAPPPGRSRFPRLPAFSRGTERDRHERPRSGPQRALGYTTFPDRRRAVSPESRYQARRIRAACEVRGMVLHKLVGDVQSYSGPDLERPGLIHAMELLEAGEATALVVAGLDRLSRSAANLGTLIERLDRIGARLVVIDIELDTQTDEGRMAARTLINVGALERGRGGQPVQAAARRSGGGGGRPAVADLPLLQRRIATMRASGMTLQAIADTLNREGVPTLRGGAKWRPSSVQAATGYKRPSQHSHEDQDPDP
jgi:DNA invertase Pin-like site-specific DNA recombinase